MAKIVTIYTDSTKPRRYVQNYSRRDGVIDNNLLVETTTNVNEAYDFGSVSEAKKLIPRLHNPHERVFNCTKADVVRPAGHGSSQESGLR